eukprot:TRINITY_DN13503_c0_g1_i1.p2 TRINITY_DN13503_c0_g1~~TRINITY_DN13503_c0_g1_i1.p2  ORF type:complete len:101 (-),score=15.31 TRINITY_DN13503_c0_g1_i1:164-466(-)
MPLHCLLHGCLQVCHFSSSHLPGEFSCSHIWNKPYDKTIGPTENMLVSALAMGEGFHNYHHTFPYAYSTSEWGQTLNSTTKLIDLMAYTGQAYDLRTISS